MKARSWAPTYSTFMSLHFSQVYDAVNGLFHAVLFFEKEQKEVLIEIGDSSIDLFTLQTPWSWLTKSKKLNEIKRCFKGLYKQRGLNDLILCDMTLPKLDFSELPKYGAPFWSLSTSTSWGPQGSTTSWWPFWSKRPVPLASRIT